MVFVLFQRMSAKTMDHKTMHVVRGWKWRGSSSADESRTEILFVQSFLLRKASFCTANKNLQAKYRLELVVLFHPPGNAGDLWHTPKVSQLATNQNLPLSEALKQDALKLDKTVKLSNHKSSCCWNKLILLKIFESWIYPERKISAFTTQGAVDKIQRLFNIYSLL